MHAVVDALGCALGAGCITCAGLHCTGSEALRGSAWAVGLQRSLLLQAWLWCCQRRRLPQAKALAGCSIPAFDWPLVQPYKVKGGNCPDVCKLLPGGVIGRLLCALCRWCTMQTTTPAKWLSSQVSRFAIQLPCKGVADLCRL